jgi:hypothetical protein
MCNRKYGEYTVDYGKDNRFVYLHLNLSFDDLSCSVYIDQKDYYLSILSKFDLTNTRDYSVPHSMNLTECELVNEDVSDQIKNDMLSTVMSLYWGAKRSRPDILFNVSYLANTVKYQTQRI